MKHRFVYFLAILIGFAVMAGLAVQKEQKPREEQNKEMFDTVREKIRNLRPAGVSSENWIPLSANVGIVLKPTTRMLNSSRSAYTGTIMFKATHNSPWQVLIIDNPIK